MQWTQYAVDVVCSGCSMQWNSGIWWWGHCLWCKKVKPVDAVDAVCSGHSGCTGIVVFGGVSDVYCIQCIHLYDLFAPKTMSPPPYTTIPLGPLRTASTVYYIHCIHWFDLSAPKTMSPPPYTTIPLHPVHTASSVLTFLHQRQCPHHHIPLFNCILCPLHTASTAYCVHCILRRVTFV